MFKPLIYKSTHIHQLRYEVLIPITINSKPTVIIRYTYLCKLTRPILINSFARTELIMRDPSHSAVNQTPDEGIDRQGA